MIKSEDSTSSVESDEFYEVERILDHRVYQGNQQFLLSWKNYDCSFDSWEPIGNN